MSKYIVDTDDFEHLFKVDSIGVMGIGKSLSDEEKDHSWSRFKDVGEFEELTAEYVNEHFGELQDEAYQQGLEDGKKAFDLLDAERDSEYQRGLNDAWEAARKIAQQWEEDSDTEHRLVIDDSIRITLDSMTASEAIDKIKAYEDKRSDRIEVGDEVEAPQGKAIVTAVKDDLVHYFYSGGDFGCVELYHVTKTGRHFDIASILEAMRQ